MKLNIADLSENCYPENVMLGKEDKDFTARVKARVMAEIEAENRKAEPKKEIGHIHPKRIMTLAFVAALIMSFGLAAYAAWSIHTARQQELKEEMNMVENHSDSYVEYEVPSETVPGIVLLSAINDGMFQEIYVNVSPVTEEEIDGYPEQPTSFLWYIVGSDIQGFATPWIRSGTVTSTPEELRTLVKRDAYDAQSQTLTLQCTIFSDLIFEFLEKTGNDDIELELFLAENYTATRSFGRITLNPTNEDLRVFDFEGARYVDEDSGKEVELVGLELTPISAVWKLRYAEAEAVYTGNDTDLQIFWINIEDRVCSKVKIIFSDGSSFSTYGSRNSPYEDGIVNYYTKWREAINIYDIQKIVLDDTVLWENK